MRRVLVATLILAEIALLFGAAQIPRASDQMPMILWINDSFVANGGKGIFQLTTDGNLKLLIPDRLIGATSYGVSMVMDSRGQIFLLDYDDRRILKATPAGDVSPVVQNLTIANPASMAVDVQGNFIIADNVHNTISKVSPNGKATQVAQLPSCPPNELDAIPIAIDQDGDYIVALNCQNAPKLLRVKPTGEAAVIVDNDPQFSEDGGTNIVQVMIDPAGQGYLVAVWWGQIFRVSSTGAVTTFAESWGFGLVSLAIGPGGFLFGVDTFPPQVIEYFPDGSRKILFRGEPLSHPNGVLVVSQ
jgi:hypothetical protein